MSPIVITIVVIAVIALYLISVYNQLVVLKTRILEALSGIDVQLKRRADLIPNLIETVKGYMKHEKEVLENVTKARTSLMNAKGVEGKAKADNMLEGTLKTLFAVSENYPQLRANENFIQLQEELTGTENKISYARQHYNDMVMELNTKIQVFPSSIIAGIMNFKEKEMFEATDEEKKNIKVKF